MLSDKKENKMQFILPMLFVLFVGLKLMGYITWSWWLVTAPLWGSIIVGGLISYFAMKSMIKILLPLGNGYTPSKKMWK